MLREPPWSISWEMLYSLFRNPETHWLDWQYKGEASEHISKAQLEVSGSKSQHAGERVVHLVLWPAPFQNLCDSERSRGLHFTESSSLFGSRSEFPKRGAGTGFWEQKRRIQLPWGKCSQLHAQIWDSQKLPGEFLQTTISQMHAERIVVSQRF